MKPNSVLPPYFLSQQTVPDMRIWLYDLYIELIEIEESARTSKDTVTKEALYACKESVMKEVAETEWWLKNK